MVALMVAAVCVATTVLTCRPMGMRLGDVPFFSFSMLVASIIWLLSLPSAVAHITLGHITHATPSTLLARTFGVGLEWLFHQPAMYALCIPILGIALDVVVHLTGGQHRFRGVILFFIGLYGFLSFGAWAADPGCPGHRRVGRAVDADRPASDRPVRQPRRHRQGTDG